MAQAGKPRPDRKQVRVRLLPHSDVPVAYATGVIVNFTGEDFVISFVEAIPPAFGGPGDIPDEIEGKVVIRATMTPGRWVAAVDSFVRQLDGLREDGVLPPGTDGKSMQGAKGEANAGSD